MRVVFLWLLASTKVLFCVAQLQTLDVTGAGSGAYGSVKYNDPMTIGSKKAAKINYSEIRGKYFWDDNWKSGFVVLKNGKAVKLENIKLNFYTNEVHYIDNLKVELAVEVALLKGVILFSGKENDTTKFTFKVYLGLIEDNQAHLFQVLNQGKVQLLKFTSVILRKGDYDAMMGKNDYSFISSKKYFVGTSNRIKPLSKISKTSLGAALDIPVSEIEEWIKNNKLKGELDVIEFINFFNSKN